MSDLTQAIRRMSKRGYVLHRRYLTENVAVIRNHRGWFITILGDGSAKAGNLMSFADDLIPEDHYVR